MPGSISIRRSLLTNLLLVIVLLSGAIMAATFVASNRAVRALSKSIIERTIDLTDSRLRRFFDPVVTDLGLMREWGRRGLLDIDRPRPLNRLLVPLMRRNPQVSSLVIADTRGHEYMLQRRDGRWYSRQTRRDEWGDRTRWLEWTDADPTPTVSWKTLDYDPRQRPWFKGALQQRKLQERSSGSAMPDTRVFWTRPYTFYTTQQPGLTASIAYDTDGREHVVGFDVALSDLSKFTAGLKVSPNGRVVVLSDDGRVIGLPNEARFDTPAKRRAALLKQPAALGIPLAADAAHAFANRSLYETGPLRFVSGDQTWWAEARPFDLAGNRTVWSVVLVPESDLLGRLVEVRVWIVLITLGVIAIAVVRAIGLSRRYSQPLQVLVQQSDRISRLNLYKGRPVESSVTEVRQLAEAHERMRESLQTLLKLERDLQLARDIQQRTLPANLPTLSGYALGTWSEPAEETGGDTFDVIGYCTDEAGRRLCSDRAEAAVLLLADATGHGIGPALSATQVRAMLRMAVRTGEDLHHIVHHLNDQLCADLHGGRFITAWLATLEPAAHTLTAFSAGQAPILHYRAATASFDELGADSPPLGVL
ncbi:MAG: SpoIIE family protein phosphatase, partial [Gammaproteobacteria bacterium]